ncbi:MAG: hypothetical protein QMD13_09330 [Candidatus Bathyarchaeia archaeon]|nr:hypothetical protein [Candidatus Bathyarchaeia archaeon]
MKDSTVLGITGMVCGTIGMALCLLRDYDHTVVAAFFTLIGTIIGYAYGVRRGGNEH